MLLLLVLFISLALEEICLGWLFGYKNCHTTGVTFRWMVGQVGSSVCMTITVTDCLTVVIFFFQEICSVFVFVCLLVVGVCNDRLMC